MTPYGRVAVEFASALVKGDFARAQEFLDPALREELSPEALRGSLYEMFRDYSDGEPRSVHYDEEGTLEDWRGKLPDDVGWAYVGIEGDDFVEAVSVIVTNVGGKLLIRDIEWGRP